MSILFVTDPDLHLSEFYYKFLLFCGIGALAGFSSHLAYYVHSFRNKDAAQIILVNCLLGIGLPIIVWGFFGYYTAFIALSTFLSYVIFLLLSISLYRTFLHPLRHFPGPLLAKLTKLYGPWLARKYKIHEEYMLMHEKFGTFVRSGMVP
jgi:hypothetical protein